MDIMADNPFNILRPKISSMLSGRALKGDERGSTRSNDCKSFIYSFHSNDKYLLTIQSGGLRQKYTPTNWDAEKLSSSAEHKLRALKTNTKNFIYERQKHICSVSTLAQQARKEFFNFNYIWTFLWAKQWELGSDESRMRRSIKCTTGHLQENCSLVSCIRCSIDRAEKQFNCNNKIKSLKFGQKVLKHEWDGRARSDRLIVASWNWWKEMTIAF